MESRLLVFLTLVLIYILGVSTEEVFTKSPNCEDDFIKHFGNLPNLTYIPWENVSKWDKQENRIALMTLCNEAHGVRVKGSFFIEEVMFVEQIKLIFDNPAYNPILIDLLRFKSRADERYLPGHAKNLEELVQFQTWHITQGLRSDCVYYVQSIDNLGQVKLMEHVCGLYSWGH